MKNNKDLEAYHSDMPFPEIKVMGKNKEYADILMKDYAGFVSELTAINQYFYHDVVLAKDYPDIAIMLKNIAIVEMNHLEVLAQLIILLGGEPKYISDDVFWNGDFVYYGNNVIDRLNNDLQAEQDAIENYEAHIKLIDDPYIKNILRRIVLDEEVHISLFNKAIAELNNDNKEIK